MYQPRKFVHQTASGIKNIALFESSLGTLYAYAYSLLFFRCRCTVPVAYVQYRGYLTFDLLFFPLCCKLLCWKTKAPIHGHSYRATFFRFFLFFPRKTGIAGKTGNISKVWKFNRGHNAWKASHSNIWRKKNWKIWKYKNLREKNIWKFRQKVLRQQRPSLAIFVKRCPE